MSQQELPGVPDVRAAWQADFIVELCDAVMRDLIVKARTGQLPNTWDGHELRALVADAFAASNVGLCSPRRGRQDRARRRAYLNELIVRNLP